MVGCMPPASQGSPLQVPSPGFGQLSCRLVPSQEAGRLLLLPLLYSRVPNSSPSLTARSQVSPRPPTTTAAVAVDFLCTSAEASPLPVPLPGIVPRLGLPAHTSYCCAGSHTWSTNCSPPHVFSVHRYRGLVAVILCVCRTVNGFGSVYRHCVFSFLPSANSQTLPFTVHKSKVLEKMQDSEKSAQCLSSSHVCQYHFKKNQ